MMKGTALAAVVVAVMAVVACEPVAPGTATPAPTAPTAPQPEPRPETPARDEPAAEPETPPRPPARPEPAPPAPVGPRSPPAGLDTPPQETPDTPGALCEVRPAQCPDRPLEWRYGVGASIERGVSVEEDGSHVKRRDAQASKDFFEILPYAIYGQGDIKYKTDPAVRGEPWPAWGLYVLRWTGGFYAAVRGAPPTSQVGSTLEFTITATDDSYDPDDPDTQGKITYTLIVTVTEPTHE